MAEVNRIIHEPARLRIVTLLSGVESADFNFLLSTLGLTRGNLSSHMDRLEKADYVAVAKQFRGKMPHTDYILTAAGRQALNAYWDELAAIRRLGASEAQLAGRPDIRDDEANAKDASDR